MVEHIIHILEKDYLYFDIYIFFNFQGKFILRDILSYNFQFSLF